MRATALAWAAGLFDGEGCISIVRVPAASALNCRTERYTLTVKVAMCHRVTVQRLRDLFDVGTVQRGVARSIRCNPSHVWVCQAQKAQRVLMALRPHLITKAAEADVALAFMQLPSAAVGGAHGNPVTSPRLVSKRRALYWKLRKLKSRWRFYAKTLSRRDKREAAGRT